VLLRDRRAGRLPEPEPLQRPISRLIGMWSRCLPQVRRALIACRENRNLSARRLSQLILKVGANPNYRDKARWFQKVLEETRGLDVAADIIERVFAQNPDQKGSDNFIPQPAYKSLNFAPFWDVVRIRVPF